MILFDYEKMMFLSETIQDPSCKEFVSFIVEICTVIFFIFFLGFLFGQMIPVGEWILDKLFDYIDRKKVKADKK